MNNNLTSDELEIINSAMGYQVSIANSKSEREELLTALGKLNYILDNDSTIS